MNPAGFTKKESTSVSWGDKLVGGALTSQIFVGAVAVINPTLPMTAEPQWLPMENLSSSAVTWKNPATSSHPTMLSAEVKKFQMAMFNPDMEALRDIFDIAHGFFWDVSGLTWTYEANFDNDTQSPLLFLQFDTHGMDLDEQIRREVNMHEAFAANDRWRKAKEYNVVTVV